MIPFYEDLAKASYRNSLSLMADSETLLKKKRYSTALALAVLAGEEFAKAYLCKCYSCGKISKHKLDDAFKEHDPKQIELTRILTSAYLFTRFYAPAIQHDAKTTNHAEHILPYVKIEPSAAMEAVHGLTTGIYKKLPALYVGKSRGKIYEPSVVVGQKECEEMMPTLGTFIYGFDIILSSTDETFGKIFNQTNNIFYIFMEWMTKLIDEGSDSPSKP